MNCTGCGGALPAKSDICRYCGLRNDTDLRRFDVLPGAESERPCPRCGKMMQTTAIRVGGQVNVERCLECHGIFFDPYELEDLIDAAKGKVYEADYVRIASLIEEARKPEPAIGYVRCPVCDEPMHRKAYGYRSGVVVDHCKGHGVWLDGGELDAILRWVKVGGLEASGGGVPMGWDPSADGDADEASADSGDEKGQDSSGEKSAPRRRARRRKPGEALTSFSPSSGGPGPIAGGIDFIFEQALGFLVRLMRS